VAKLNIPQRSREGLSKLLSLHAGLFDGLVVTLERQSPSVKIIINPSAVITVPGIDKADLEKILRAVSALYMVHSSEDVPLDTFVRDVSEAIEGFDAEAQSEQSKGRLRRILGVDSLASSSKALTLLTDQERTLHGVKILTDVRHAFQADPEKEPYGAVIVNVLKLTYHESDQHKDFYVALDGDDLASLRTALDRAEVKIKTLRGKLDAAGIAYLGGADRKKGDE
jgi:hypothetical protein